MDKNNTMEEGFNMNFNADFYVVGAVLKGTPIYVWVLLAYLISRGIKERTSKPLSLKKMLILPIIFTFWGLDTMFMNFTNIGLNLMVYIIIAGAGTFGGFLLYNSTRKVFYHDEIYYCSGSWLSLFIILTNFLIKYILNVLVAINPTFYNSTEFCLLYSIISGFLVGLFIGGWLQAYFSYKNCLMKVEL
jgi:hypothetical protein